MGRLESALGFGWGAGAFFGGVLVISTDYGLATPSVILSFFLTASIGVFAVVGYMSVTERSAVREDKELEFSSYFWKLFKC